MFRKCLICSLFLISIFFSACKNEPMSTAIPKVVRSNWLDDFLVHPACQLPCWKEITPGITSFEDAQKILLEDPNLKVSGLTNLKYQEIEWDFIQDGSVGLLNTGHSQDDVEKILFYLAKDQWLPLGDLLAAYPNPSIITFRTLATIGFCEISVIYETHGMLVLGSEIPCEAIETDGVYTTKVIVTPGTLIQGISLYTKEEVMAQANMLDGIEWKGYGEYGKEYRP